MLPLRMDLMRPGLALYTGRISCVKQCVPGILLSCLQFRPSLLLVEDDTVGLLSDRAEVS